MSGNQGLTPSERSGGARAVEQRVVDPARRNGVTDYPELRHPLVELVVQAVVGLAPEREDDGVRLDRRLYARERVARHKTARHDRLRGRQRLEDDALSEQPRVEVGADALVDVLAHHEVLAD